MMAAVLPTRESGPYSAISSAPTPRAALPLIGRTSTKRAVSGGIPKKENTGLSQFPRTSIAPEARSMETAVRSITRAGTRVMSSCNPSAPPVRSRL